MRSHEYGWKGLQLVDTPGVGALGGAEDEIAALAAAAEADLVLWVTSSDGKQQATVAPILRAVSGRPLMALVNHKGTFTTDELEAGLPDDLLFDDIAGQESRIKFLVGRSGTRVGDLAIVHAQLGLARRARDEDWDELWVAARLPQLETAVLQAASAAAQRRPEIRAAQLRDAALTCHDAAMAASLAIHAAARHRRDGFRKHRRQQRQAIAELRLQVHREIERAYTAAQGRLAAALRVARVEPHRGKASAHLHSEAEATFDEFIQTLTNAIVILWAKTQPLILEDPDRIHPLVPELPDAKHSPLAGDPSNARGVDWVARGLKLAVAGAAIFATEGLAAPMVIGLLGERGLTLSRSALPSVGDEQAARDNSVAVAQAMYADQLVFAKARVLRDLTAWLEDLVEPAAEISRQAASSTIEQLSVWSAELKRLSGLLEETTSSREVFG
jgi:hypothetical protein